jgi:vanillate O-demethylase monooxygenase subunit
MKREPTPPAHCTFEPEDWLRLAKCWHPVARACDVGPAPVKATLLDEQLVIYRINDQVVVARDVCPHRGVPLTLGFHDEHGIICPYHGLRFGEDGRCNRIPSSPDQPVPAKLNLINYAVEERFGLIWTCLAFDPDNPAPLPTMPHWDDDGFQQINCPAFEVNGFAGRQVEGFWTWRTLPGSTPIPLPIPIISWSPPISRRRRRSVLLPITGAP